MVRFFGGTPEGVSFRLVCVATARLPTPAHVKRTLRAFHPIGLWALVRVPPGDLEEIAPPHPL